MATTVSPLGSYTAKIRNGGQVVATFSAPSLANAQTVGQSLATLLGVSIELYGDGVLGEAAPNTYTPASRAGGGVTVSTPDNVFAFFR